MKAFLYNLLSLISGLYSFYLLYKNNIPMATFMLVLSIYFDILNYRERNKLTKQ